MSTLTTPTFKTEALSCYFNYSFLDDCYSEVTAYTARDLTLIELVIQDMYGN